MFLCLPNAYTTNKVAYQTQGTDAVFFDEVNEGGSLNLDRLALSVEERQHEVKEVALA